MKKVWGAPLWVWAAALVPRLSLCFLVYPNPQRFLKGDSLGYLALARNLVSHGVFSAGEGPDFPPNTFRTPGYPLFLTLLRPWLDSPALAVAIAQSLLGAITVVWAWRWLDRTWGGRGAAVGALALALDPVTVLHTPLILCETLFVFLLTVALIRTLEALSDASSKKAAECGILWSLSAMVKPISLYLLLFLCWIWRNNKRALLAFLAASFVFPAAWVVRNWQATGIPVFSSIAGESLLRYPAAGVESLRTGRPLSEFDAELRAAVDARHAPYSSDAERNREYGRAAMPIIKAHPMLLAQYCLGGVVKVLGGTGLEHLLEWTGHGAPPPLAMEFRAKISGQGTLAMLRRHPWLVPLQLLYMAALSALYWLAARGLLRLWREGRRLEVLLLIECVGYFLAMASSQGYYRYRIPLMPGLAACAAAGFSRKTRTS